jgi:hypothetical protein
MALTQLQEFYSHVHVIMREQLIKWFVDAILYDTFNFIYLTAGRHLFGISPFTPLVLEFILFFDLISFEHVQGHLQTATHTLILPNTAHQA